MLTKPILLLSLFISCFQFCIAQPSVNMIDVVSEKLIGNIRSKQTEQLFVVTDKSFYRSGEGIWFRVFLLRSASQKMSHVTKNVFIDFINANDSVVSTLLIDADRAQSGARLNIAQSVAT